jgi:aconitate hydratase
LRIHSSNLVGTGVLPLQFEAWQSDASLGLSGRERFDLLLSDDLKPNDSVEVVAKEDSGTSKRFTVRALATSPIEVRYFRNGGILQTVIREMAAL